MLDEHDQSAIIRGLRDGQRDAWTALYDGYRADVWRYVARLVGGRSSDVADVVQETFLAAARGARQFDANRGTLWCWLAGIAHHQVAIHWRKIGNSERLLDLAESGVLDLRQWWCGTESAEDLREKRELADFVRSILFDLPADYATLLTAKYLDDQNLNDMALRFGGTVEAIKSKLARARREFRAKFDRLTREPTPSLREPRDAPA